MRRRRTDGEGAGSGRAQTLGVLLLVLGRLVLLGGGGGGGGGGVVLGGGGLLAGLGGLVGVLGRDDLVDDAGDGLVARGAVGQVEQVEDPHPGGGGG